MAYKPYLVLFPNSTTIPIAYRYWVLAQIAPGDTRELYISADYAFIKNLFKEMQRSMHMRGVER